MFCSEWSLVKHTLGAVTIIPLRCRCWSCTECRPARVQRLIEEARAGLPTIFITLTSRRRPNRSPHRAARDLVTAWRTVRQRYIKVHGPGSLSFLAVFEATKNGWPHLHIVARCRWIDQRWLSRQMAALIGSPIVDVRKVRGVREVANYVSKYIGKNPHRFEGVKRYWRSLDYLEPVEQAPPVEELEVPLWVVEPRHWTNVVKDYEEYGWEPTFEGGGAVVRYRGRVFQ